MDEFLEMGSGLLSQGECKLLGAKIKKKENGIDFIKENREDVQKIQKENTWHNIIKAKAEKFKK